MVSGHAQVVTERRTRLLPIRGVMPILDKDEDQVLRLIEEGQLRWAWNVALSKDRGAMELRVLPQAVGDFMAGRPCKIEFEEVVNALAHGETETITAKEIDAALNVSRLHVYDLIGAGHLKASGWRRGPGGSARVSLASFLRFLRQRCWPFPVTDQD